jgi:hypothetical protein
MEIDAGPMMVIEALKPAVFVWGSVRRSLQEDTAL